MSIVIQSPSFIFIPTRNREATEKTYSDLRASCANAARREASDNDDEIDFFVYCGDGALSKLWREDIKGKMIHAAGLAIVAVPMVLGSLVTAFIGMSMLLGHVQVPYDLNLLALPFLGICAAFIYTFLSTVGTEMISMIRNGYTERFADRARDTVSNVVGVGRKALYSIPYVLTTGEPCVRTIFHDAIGSIRKSIDEDGNTILRVIDRSGNCVVHVVDAKAGSMTTVSAIAAMEMRAQR